MTPFWLGDVLENTWIASMILAHWKWSGIKMTFASTSPLMHSKLHAANLLNYSYVFVSHTLSSLMSCHTRWPSSGLATANSDLPNPNESSCPMNAAVSALSPVIILTSCELWINSWITDFVSFFRGHSATRNPQKVSSHSAYSLV